MTLNFATTTLPTLLLWALGLIIFLVGGLLGYFNMAVDARRKADAADLKVENAREDARRKLEEAEKKLQEAQSLKAQLPRSYDGEAGLLNIKTDENLRVQIEMDGKPLTAPLTPERRKRLLEIISHFRPMLEEAPPASAALQSPPVSSASPARTEPLPVSSIAPTVKPAPAVKPVSVMLNLAPQKTQTDPETEFKLLSMVQQIDVVLQRRIAGTPLETLGIHLQDALQGGLQVVIGAQKFETIDDVPDANIKTAIRAAIAEWEQKYVPGA